VTATDLEVERHIRRSLGDSRPSDGILGEELGGAVSDGRTWVIDPVDATKNFMRGNPIFATLIALLEDGEPVLGVVSSPMLGSRWCGGRGRGATLNGQPIKVSSVARLDQAVLSYTNFLTSFERNGLDENFLRLARRCWIARGFGNFWQHMLLAQGAVDIAVEIGVQDWDIAAVKVIVEEAGGSIGPVGPTGDPDRVPGSVLSSNGVLQEAAREVFWAVSGRSMDAGDRALREPSAARP
jgi:histidinol-phosphatase